MNNERENEVKELHVCCICGRFFEGWGNNPDGAAWKNADGTIEFGEFTEDDRCCDECDNKYVIPGRIYQLYHNKK